MTDAIVQALQEQVEESERRTTHLRKLLYEQKILNHPRKVGDIVRIVRPGRQMAEFGRIRNISLAFNGEIKEEISVYYERSGKFHKSQRHYGLTDAHIQVIDASLLPRRKF